MPMNRRERMKRCYFHEEIDRPAVYSRTGFPGNDPTYDRLRAYLQAHAELKVAWGASRFVEPEPQSATTEPYSEDFERRVVLLQAPKSTLRATRLVSLKGQPGLDETHFIKSREDAQAYLSLPRPPVGGDTSSFQNAGAEVGDRGIVDIKLGLNPAGQVADLMGSETLAMMSVTDRDVVHELCRRRMEIQLELLKFLLLRGLGPFFSMEGEEYLVPPLHGPADFNDFNARYDKPIIDLVHDAGGRMHIHCHGSVKKVIGSFVEMGCDVLHPFEAPPQGDITPAEAKAAARGRMTLEGNIQIHRLYEATPDAVRHETTALIPQLFDDHRGLIVCPTASPYIRGAGEKCFPMYKAMIDTVVNWRS